MDQDNHYIPCPFLVYWFYFLAGILPANARGRLFIGANLQEFFFWPKKTSGYCEMLE
jgi:hypothetical protein